MNTLLHGQRQIAMRLLGPASWLSGRLSFSRKYLLVGAVMLIALTGLSVPLLRQAHEDAQRIGQERLGLAVFEQQAAVLARLVLARGADLAIAGSPPQAPRLAAELREAPQTPARLKQALEPLRTLSQDDDAQRRFAAFTGAINAQLALMRDSARLHRLNVDAELDSALDMLLNRLPLLIETLGRQQDALALPDDSLSSYALGAQVLLSESAPALQAGITQLDGGRGEAALLQSLARLQTQIEQQQDAVDKLIGRSGEAQELRRLARRNLADAQALLQACTRQADARLRERLDALQRNQWGVGALLIAAVAAIAYLFAGIYVSTLRSLRRLAQGTEAFCAGQLQTRITARRRSAAGRPADRARAPPRPFEEYCA